MQWWLYIKTEYSQRIPLLSSSQIQYVHHHLGLSQKTFWTRTVNQDNNVQMSPSGKTRNISRSSNIQMSHTFIFLGGRLRLTALSNSARIISSSLCWISYQNNTQRDVRIKIILIQKENEVENNVLDQDKHSISLFSLGTPDEIF